MTRRRIVSPGTTLAVLAALTFLGCGSVAEPGTPFGETDPLLEVRLAYEEPGDDLEPVSFEGDTLYLAPEPIISDPDFLHVDSQVGERAVGLSVSCTAEAHDRMEAASRTHLGKPMVVMWRSQVRAAPVVRSQVGCRPRAALGWDTTREEAERIAERVRERWPEEGSAEVQ